MYDICCVGHITLDRVVTPKAVVHMPGGTSIYFSNAIHNMDVSYALVTALAEKEMYIISDLREKGIDVKVLPSAHTVCFENIYTENQDHRTQKVSQKADPFTVSQLQNIEAKFFHLGPLLADDIPVELIRTLSEKGRVSLDAQGYLREVRRSARVLFDWGVKEVVITLGSRGSVIYNGQKFYTIPAYTPVTSVVDATGCGDTYMAGYLYQRIKGAQWQEAGEFAAAMATLKIESSGPFTGTEEDVLELQSGSAALRPRQIPILEL